MKKNHLISKLDEIDEKIRYTTIKEDSYFHRE